MSSAHIQWIKYTQRFFRILLILHVVCFLVMMRAAGIRLNPSLYVNTYLLRSTTASTGYILPPNCNACSNQSILDSMLL